MCALTLYVNITHACYEFYACTNMRATRVTIGHLEESVTHQHCTAEGFTYTPQPCGIYLTYLYRSSLIIPAHTRTNSSGVKRWL